MERLANYVKNNLNCTKKELLSLNLESRILVNGKKMSLQYKLEDSDIVTIDNEVLNKNPKVYYAYNKPIGIICTNDKTIKNNIINELNLSYRVFPVGRLDKDSHGLIFLTNDGDFCHKILEDEKITKEYLVTLENEVTDSFINDVTRSIIIKGKETIPAIVNIVNSKQVKIILSDGKYHQVRRLVKEANNKVIDLYRIRIGKFNIDDLNGKNISPINDISSIY